MANLLIVRHGEPRLRGVFLGALDPSLSEVGWQQASQFVVELAVESEWPIFASPLRRAAETASCLSCLSCPGKPVIWIEEFREIGYGPWEGLTWAEIEERYPEEARRKSEDWFGYTVPGAESWSNFQVRVQTGLRRIAVPAIIIAHLGVNSVLRETITGEPAVTFTQDYCEIVRLTL